MSRSPYPWRLFSVGKGFPTYSMRQKAFDMTLLFLVPTVHRGNAYQFAPGDSCMGSHGDDGVGWVERLDLSQHRWVSLLPPIFNCSTDK
ncbi:MAG: hypothetical protein KQH63_21260 [Desulfobulbaceae bacterium]|nr:hypothetical protein [Desulfobulbaceae bacterium]